MSNILKLSYKSLKNIVFKKQFLIIVLACYAYIDLLWLFIIHPHSFHVENYNFEFTRVIYIAILYLDLLILGNDIFSHATKFLFTGIFTRTEILLSKILELLESGIILFAFIEINLLTICLSLYGINGLSHFLLLKHFNMFLGCILINFCIGALCLLILIARFNTKFTYVVTIITLCFLNFQNALFVTAEHRGVALSGILKIYSKTPFYIATSIFGSFSSTFSQVCIMIAWGLIFCFASFIILNKREIK